MNSVRPRLTRMVASVAVLSMLSIGGITSMAQAAPGVSPSALSVQTALASSPADDIYTAQVLNLINQKRAAVGSAPVKWNQQIGNVSQEWSEHLGEETKSDTFDWSKIHRSDAGGSLLPSGVTWYREIIGFNGSAQSIVDWWMGSASHKAAMLDPKATDIGIGYVVPTSGPYAGWHMVVSNLAAYPASATTPVTKTPIAIKAASLNGLLGLATSKEIYGLKNSGAYQMYQRGAIIYSPATGARVSTGAIRTTWASTGFENGYMGYPTSDEVGGLKNGGAYQTYQNGAIVWSENTGARVSVGGIRTIWASTGYENGYLGYPTSNEIGGLKDGGVYQMYEGGAIIWSPASGGYVSTGGIRATWGSTGYEGGRLGYPTSNEYSTGGGGVAQNYQGGTIKWSPVTGSSVVYK